MRRLIVCAVFALVAGCGSDLLAPVADCNGDWVGTQNGYNLGLTMLQTDSTITGTARITGLFGFAEGTVSGTCVNPSVNLTIDVVGYPSVTYIGTLSPTTATINGRLNGSGFANTEVDVSKR